MTPHQRLAGSARPCPGSSQGGHHQEAHAAALHRLGRGHPLPAEPWRHLRETWVRYARWDLASVDLVDGRSGERLCTLYPLDKRANADGVRRPTSPGGNDGGASAGAGELPPLLKGMLDAQAATGLPPAWLPHDKTPGPGEDNDRGETS